jgi:hypothetical protein
LEFSFFSQQTKAESLHVYEVRIQKGLRLDSRAEATQAMWTMVGNLSQQWVEDFLVLSSLISCR